jgi:hypothetical protein
MLGFLLAPATDMQIRKRFGTSRHRNRGESFVIVENNRSDISVHQPNSHPVTAHVEMVA